MKPLELIRGKRQHAARLVNQHGAAGESEMLGKRKDWLPRPKGPGLKVLLSVLRDRGIVIKRSAFDAIAFPEPRILDFRDRAAVEAALPDMIFIEIKTATKKQVGADFSGYFFSLTEGELEASEALGDRHRVVLYHKSTGTSRTTSVPEILARAKSMNWQVSVQL